MGATPSVKKYKSYMCSLEMILLFMYVRVESIMALIKKCVLWTVLDVL